MKKKVAVKPTQKRVSEKTRISKIPTPQLINQLAVRGFSVRKANENAHLELVEDDRKGSSSHASPMMAEGESTGLKFVHDSLKVSNERLRESISSLESTAGQLCGYNYDLAESKKEETFTMEDAFRNLHGDRTLLLQRLESVVAALTKFIG